nr:MAG TPA: hypothetical protein [Caudoviricetes sp.]
MLELSRLEPHRRRAPIRLNTEDLDSHLAAPFDLHEAMQAWMSRVASTSPTSGSDAKADYER